MKAWKVWDRQYSYCSTVVFAESAGEAKKVALGTETCEDAAFVDIRVRRFPEMDDAYRGLSEINWYDMKDRMKLVELGWSCEDMSWECDECLCKSKCSWWDENSVRGEW